ncbi:MAG: disulfide bond formation protein B [Acidimicrobiia bacterium]
MTDTADTFFTILALIADAALVVLALVGVAALASRSGRAGARRLVATIGPSALSLAFLVAAVTTAGSLYYSEIANYTPCVLCWYQRICMYPLVVILGVGWWRKDAATWLFAAPFVVCGTSVALYHYLVERYPSLGEGLSCSVTAPCTVPYFETLGFMTLAWMSLTAFAIIGALLAADRVWARSPTGVAP